MGFLAKTPPAPYYAAVFASIRTEGDRGYAAMADRMAELAAGQPGYLGVESVRDENGNGITVSYWRSLEDIRTWKEHALHKVAQEKGKSEWYQAYSLRVCKVERDHYFNV